MGNVDVNSAALSKTIALCSAAKGELKRTAADIKSKYVALGANWKDKKYKEFGEIIEGCCNSLNMPITELERCEAFLERLLNAAIEYEGISLVGGGGANSYQTQTEQAPTGAFSVDACNNALAREGSNMRMVDISGIDMSADQADGSFWSHHGRSEGEWQQSMGDYNSMMRDFSNGMSVDQCYDRYPAVANMVFGRQPISLCNDNGNLSVENGRHRIAMAQRLGIRYLPAIVY